MLIQSAGALYLRFLRESGLVRLVGPVALMRGIREILGVFELVAIEVEMAETREIGIAAAARDPSSYPHLSRLHDTFDAILRQPLPAPLSVWAERVIAAPPVAILEPLGEAVVDAAATPGRRGAIARYFLFTTIWLGLRIMFLRHAESFTQHDVHERDLAVIAERVMRKHLAEASPEPTTRRLELMIAHAITRLDLHAEIVKDALRNVHEDIVAAIALRSRIEGALSRADARDATLLRNEFATALEEQHLSLELLRRRHPGALGDSKLPALRQRTKRLLDAAKTRGPGAWASRERRLLDVLFGAPAPAKELP